MISRTKRGVDLHFIWFSTVSGKSIAKKCSENHWLKCLKAPYLNVMMIYFFSNLQSAISQKMCTVSCCLNLKWNQVVVNEAGSWLGLTKVSSFKSRWFFKPVLCSLVLETLATSLVMLAFLRTRAGSRRPLYSNCQHFCFYQKVLSHL